MLDAPEVAERVQRRAGLAAGIAHMSVGAFHRAHQAAYVDEFLELEPGDWMIAGIGLLPGDAHMVRALDAQRCRYTLIERSGSVDRARVITSLCSIQHAPSDPARTIATLADPVIRIVTLTVTEKGYYDDANGDLDTTRNEVRNDIDGVNAPVTGLGYLFEAAQQRMRTHGARFTVQSCDNRPGNGDLTRHVVLQLATERDPAVAAWIAEHVSFPNSMVDRITPAIRPETVEYVQTHFGGNDQCPVVSEAFRQWVIEDNFADGRPEYDRVGAQFVSSVHPYEIMKIRLLNGSHSALAYAGLLAGHTEVHVAMHDPALRSMVAGYMAEARPTLDPVPGVDLDDYCATLVERFSNPAIGDQLARLAMDGSEKMRNFVVPAVEHNRVQGRPTPAGVLAVATWATYLRATPVDQIDDPRAVTVSELARIGGDDLRALLRCEDVFGSRLAHDDAFADEVSAIVRVIESHGLAAAFGPRTPR